MKITVERFDPTKDASPYEVSYEVPHHDKMTALEALMWIYENEAPIAFDYACHARTCGRCAMMVDGRQEFACICAIDDGDHVIAPLANYPVIHDLIVDKTAERTLASQLYERVRFEELDVEQLNTFDMTVTEQLFELEWCTRCGRCTSVCPARAEDNDYVGPMAMLGTAYRFYDPFDQADRPLEAVKNHMYSCIMCGQCTDVCSSKEIDHLKYWQELRDAAETEGYKPRTA